MDALFDNAKWIGQISSEILQINVLETLFELPCRICGENESLICGRPLTSESKLVYSILL